MFAKGNTMRILVAVLAVLFVLSCAPKVMTPIQKYTYYRAGFNDLIEFQYIPFLKTLSEEKKAEMKAEINPIVQDAYDALDLYYASVSLNKDDQEAKFQFYMKLKNEIFSKAMKYGLKFVEEDK